MKTTGYPWSLPDEKAFTSAVRVGAFKGAILDLSNKDYHGELCKEYYSSTQLKYMHSNSPEHFNAKYIAKTLEKDKTTDALILGSLVHCLALAPKEYAQEFALIPKIDRRTKEGKEFWEKFAVEHAGKMAITQEVKDKADRMVDSLMSKSFIRRFLEVSVNEASLFWQCPFSGLNLRAKIDAMTGDAFGELKTTSSANPINFSKQLDNLSYDLSARHYQIGIQEVLKLDMENFYFFCVENEEPYTTQYYCVPEEFWEVAGAKWTSAISKIEKGIKYKTWPGYFDDEGAPPEICQPAWTLKQYIQPSPHEVAIDGGF